MSIVARCCVLVVVAVALPGASPAEQRVMGLATNDLSTANHWPGADAFIRSVDDSVSSSPSMFNGSAPNTNGSWSFNAFDFVGNGSLTDPFMPPGMNAMTFLEGTVTVDTDVATSGGGPIISAWDVSGTEPFSGHGPYSAQITAVNSGSYDSGTHAFALNVDFVANLMGGPANAVNFDLTGSAWFLELSGRDEGGTGNPYVDGVVLPLALRVGAQSLFVITGSGTVPASSGFPMMPVQATIVALSPSTLPVDESSFGSVKGLYRTR